MGKEGWWVIVAYDADGSSTPAVLLVTDDYEAAGQMLGTVMTAAPGRQIALVQPKWVATWTNVCA